jgi:hypothetical protein
MFYQGGYYRLENGELLEVQECDEGYDFSLYDAKVNSLDGGVLEAQEWLNEEFVMQEVLGLLGMESKKYEVVENFWL